MTPKDYFEQKIPQNLREKGDLVSSVNAIYEFQLSGPQGGTWTLDLTQPGGSVTNGSSGKANCTISMSDENFVKLVSGELNPQMAYLSGKLKVAGNLGLSLKLQKFL